MRARIGYAVAFGSLLSTSILASCEVQNQGQSPPGEQFFFPSGLLLDPVRNVEPVAVCSSYDGSDPSTALASELPPPSVDLPGPRYLYVANGNNDRSFNAGALMAIDLQKFWRAWYDPHRDDPAQAGCVSALAAAGSGDPSQVAAACEACDRDPRRGGVDPFCREITLPDGTMYSRCIKPPGVAVDVMTTEDLTYTTRAQDDPIRSPCRRLPLLSQVVECDENPFVVDSVEVGDFATTLAHSIEDDVLRLWLPVRGDPSITYVDVRDHQGGLCLECGDGSDVDASCSSNAAQACGDSHRLDTLRNDPTLDVLDREPFNALVWESDQPSGDPDVRGERLAFVAHSDGIQLSVVDLDGVRGGSDPAIVDLAPIYIAGAGGVGGFGLAARPCFEAGEG
ncbi:MAG: hypothetical protein K0V04_38120, partial [Deltaproteobacteria bacterium]|nr:hypothetical protein [Deltaproteobacteria bacterium]